MQKSFQQWCPWEVKISKKEKIPSFTSACSSVLCIFQKLASLRCHTEYWHLSQVSENSAPFQHPDGATTQRIELQSSNSYWMLWARVLSMLSCGGFFFFHMGIFAIGCFAGDWNEIKVLIGVKYGSVKLSVWYLKSPLANLRYLLKDIYWALLQELIDLSSWKPPQMIKKSGRGSHCSKRKPHILFADIWASRGG